MPENFVKTDKLDSAYRLVIVAAKRSKELQRGAETRIDSSAHKNTTVAIQEVKAGKIDWDTVDRKPRPSDAVATK
jgi:DNA-directed RNA polymerase omega subunit